MVLSGQGMSAQAVGMAMAAVYPYSSPHMYDQNGRMKWGKVMWEPNPNEGPYKPFYTRNGGKHGISVEFVHANNTEELKIEIEKERKTLRWHVFICCCICALMGLKNTSKASESLEAGQDTEARNALLNAKIEKSYSCCWGIINWSIFVGALHIISWPFIWIPLLIFKCGKK